MTFVITQACIDVKDKSCIEVCPVNCIYGETEDRMCYVHPVDCIDCGVCEAACPVQAIYAEGDLPADAVRFVAINAQYFSDREGARAAVSAAADGGN